MDARQWHLMTSTSPAEIARRIMVMANWCWCGCWTQQCYFQFHFLHKIFNGSVPFSTLLYPCHIHILRSASLNSLEFFTKTPFTTAYWLQHHLAVETSTVSLRKFTEQSGRKSHKENQTTVCDKWTLSFCYPTKLMNLFGKKKTVLHVS